ncbi:MAG: thioesterase, partial [Flavobacteriaceae bacterium]|nr:thioesterase [Flavobacteriaceae bacterium]
MYFAVQAMAAELSTGALVMNKIQESNSKISMLVAQNKASFSKKATGKIKFSCYDGERVNDALQTTIKTGEGQTFWMKSVGINEDGVEVSVFEFEWTVKLKSSKQ